MLLLLTCLFKLRLLVLSKTLSHMWGKWNLPMLLLEVGLLTLINMDSFIFPAKLCPASLLFGSYCDCFTSIYFSLASFFQVTHFSTSPTVNLTCLWFLYLCYCINCSRFSVLPNVPPCYIRNIFFKVLCDLFPLLPQFCLFGSHVHLTLTNISFSNFVQSLQFELQP